MLGFQINPNTKSAGVPTKDCLTFYCVALGYTEIFISNRSGNHAGFLGNSISANSFTDHRTQVFKNKGIAE